MNTLYRYTSCANVTTTSYVEQLATGTSCISDIRPTRYVSSSVSLVCTWETQGVDWRIILRWNFRKWDVGVWTGSSWLRIGTGGEHL